jgi:hypothetical protein
MGCGSSNLFGRNMVEEFNHSKETKANVEAGVYIENNDLKLHIQDKPSIWQRLKSFLGLDLPVAM